MNLIINDAQRIVLQWVADGADLNNTPSETFKTRAVPLRNRGLVDIDKWRGRWSIATTEAGVFCLEHGHHPKAEGPMPSQPAQPKPEPEHQAKNEAISSKADAGSETEEMRHRDTTFPSRRSRASSVS